MHDLDAPRTPARLRVRLALSLLAVALVALTVGAPAADAAGTASVSISPSVTSKPSGAPVTFTVNVSCSVTGGCNGTKVSFPSTAITGDGPVTDFGSWVSNSSCTGVTKSVAGGQVTFSYGNIPTGASSCTFTVTSPRMTTRNNTQVTITPTISGTNFASSTGAAATLTLTASHDGALTKSADVSQVGSGKQFSYTVSLRCSSSSGFFGSEGTSSITITDKLPANFTYQSARLASGNGSPAPGTFTFDAATNTLTYADPTGDSCNMPDVHSSSGYLWIKVVGTAASGGTPDAPGTTVDNQASADITYLDGTPASFTSQTASVRVTDNSRQIPNPFVQKAGGTQTFANEGQYRFNGTYPYATYPGDWDGSGDSVHFIVYLQAGGTQAGLTFSAKDPLPCLTTPSSTASGPVYGSNTPGTPCANPAFVPTVVRAPFGFTATASDRITLLHTDGTTATVPFTPGKGWVIPASPAVAEIDFPTFPAEGANDAGTLYFWIDGYAAPTVATPSMLTNTVTGNVYDVSDTSTPLAPQQTASASVVVEPPSGTLIYPSLTAQNTGGCTERVMVRTDLEMATAPSAAVYVDYLAPVDAVMTSSRTQTFSIQQQQTALSGPLVGGNTYSATVTATTVPDYNGTGRTLYEWVIPAGTITKPGDYIINPPWLNVDLGLGCSGTSDNDQTSGYGTPLTACAHGGSAPGDYIRPNNTDLRANGSPIPNNWCGYSAPLTYTASNPAFSLDKSAQGNLDTSPVFTGDVGNVSPTGGTADYKLMFANTGAANLVDAVLYDVLPRTGDDRGSDFGVTLDSVGTLPANVILYYSTATNPCRPEVLPSNPGCTDDWSTTPPSPLSATTALKAVYDGIVHVNGGRGASSFSVPFSVNTGSTTVGKITWNTVAARATANDIPMAPAESSRVGLQAQGAPLEITKDTSTASYAKPGDPIDYTFTVTNNTQVTVTGVKVVDKPVNSAPSDIAPTVTGPTSLQPGQSATYTATYRVTQDDVDFGSVSDTATATAVPPTGGTLTSSSNKVTVPAVQNASLLLSKTAGPLTDVNGDGVAGSGDTIRYSFTVANQGNVTISGVTVDDVLLAGQGVAVTCAATSLAPGASTTCSSSKPYVLTSADAAAGSVSNTATASGRDPSGNSTGSNSSSTTTPLPALTLTKAADRNSLVAGQTVTYTLVATNAGATPLSNVRVSEGSFSGSGTLAGLTCDLGQGTSLQPGQAMTCTASYVVTQADVDAGNLSNTASATGASPSGFQVSADAQAKVSAAAAPSLTLAKSAGPLTDANTNGVADAGDTIRYSFEVTNTGNVTLSGAKVSDPMLAAHGITVSCTPTTVAPGQQTTCTSSAAYALTAQDVSAGAVANTATASAQDPSSSVVASAPSSTTTALPALTLTKTADQNSLVAGQTITYTLVATNSGATSLAGVSVNEDSFSGSGSLSGLTCGAPGQSGSLQPGQTLTCTASYVVTQADVDAGTLSNAATASGSSPSGFQVAAKAQTRTGSTAAPSLSLSKTAGPLTDANNDGVADAGDTIAYAFALTNGGNVTLSNLAVDDPLLSGQGISITCANASLAPGASTTCTSTKPYALTAADVSTGSVNNTATASGRGPSGTVTDSNSSSTTTPLPAITLTKTADQSSLVAGQTITYTLVATDSGATPLDNVSVNEGSFSGSGTLSGLTCGAPGQGATLQPGQSLTCTASYTVTQADVDASAADGSALTNTATATGASPSGFQVSADAQTRTAASAAPGLSLSKTAGPLTDADSDGVADAGDTIAYSFAVTNTGNTSVTGVAVSDPMLAAQGITITCTPTSLAPGQQAACTSSAAYALTAQDVSSGAVANTATAGAKDPSGKDVPPATASTTTPLPALTLTKSADRSSLVAGQTITYTLVATDSGATPLDNVSVNEGSFSGSGTLSGLTCDRGQGATLQPGQALTCTASYTVTQADVDASAADGSALTNTATATGRSSTGFVVEDDAEAQLSATADPELGLVMTVSSVTDANGNKSTDAGDEIAYELVIENNGNVTITTLGIADPLLGPVDCDATSLAPGEQTTCHPQAAYVITQDDVDAGGVSNTATASGTAPSGASVQSSDASTYTPTDQKPGLDLVKKVHEVVDRNRNGVVDEGDQIGYDFVLTNLGTVTLSDVSVDDPMLAGVGVDVSCPAEPLAPGTSVTCRSDAPYVVGTADVRAGVVHNVATASARTPAGPQIGSRTSYVDVTTADEDSSVLPSTGMPPGLQWLALLALTMLGFGVLLVRKAQEGSDR